MFNRKGQNVVEYSILIAVVVGAAIAMQTYVKRGMQSKVKDAVDHVGSSQDVGGNPLQFTQGGQYEPYYVNSHADVSSQRALHENTQANGVVQRNDINETTQKKNAVDTTLVPQHDDNAN
jgi:hypothetical protein